MQRINLHGFERLQTESFGRLLQVNRTGRRFSLQKIPALLLCQTVTLAP